MKEVKVTVINQLLRLLSELENVKRLNEGWEQDTEYLQKFIHKGYDLLGSLVATKSEKEIAVMCITCHRYEFAAIQILMSPLEVEQKAYEYTH